MLRQSARILFALALVLVLDWEDFTPPFPLHSVAQVKAQIGLDGLPPNRFHPFRGGTNCVQVVDSNGNFSCSPLVTINPTTGAFSGLGSQGNNLAFGAVLAPINSGAQALGAGDLVISTSPYTVAPSGPLIAGAVLRVRKVGPGQCQLVVAGGNGLQEFVIPTLSVNNALIGGGFDQSLLQTSFSGGTFGC